MFSAQHSSCELRFGKEKHSFTFKIVKETIAPVWKPRNDFMPRNIEQEGRLWLRPEDQWLQKLWTDPNWLKFQIQPNLLRLVNWTEQINEKEATEMENTRTRDRTGRVSSTLVRLFSF